MPKYICLRHFTFELSDYSWFMVIISRKIRTLDCGEKTRDSAKLSCARVFYVIQYCVENNRLTTIWTSVTVFCYDECAFEVTYTTMYQRQ